MSWRSREGGPKRTHSQSISVRAPPCHHRLAMWPSPWTSPCRAGSSTAGSSARSSSTALTASVTSPVSAPGSWAAYPPSARPRSTGSGTMSAPIKAVRDPSTSAGRVVTRSATSVGGLQSCRARRASAYCRSAELRSAAPSTGQASLSGRPGRRRDTEYERRAPPASRWPCSRTSGCGTSSGRCRHTADSRSVLARSPRQPTRSTTEPSRGWSSSQTSLESLTTGAGGESGLIPDAAHTCRNRSALSTGTPPLDLDGATG